MDPEQLFRFCVNPYHNFGQTQKDILAPAFLKRFPSNTKEFHTLEALWHYYANRTVDTTVRELK